MPIRAFRLALLTILALVVVGPLPTGRIVVAQGITAAPATSSDDDTTRPTINEFFPEERPLSDCLSSLPKPDCGSDARGGWAQTAVFGALLAGLAFIGWRIWAGARRRTPDDATRN